jgi:hypothetical protein
MKGTAKSGAWIKGILSRVADIGGILSGTFTIFFLTLGLLWFSGTTLCQAAWTSIGP